MDSSLKVLHWRWCVFVTVLLSIFLLYQAWAVLLHIFQNGFLEALGSTYMYVPVKFVASIGLLLRREWAILWAAPLSFIGVMGLYFDTTSAMIWAYVTVCVFLAYAKPNSEIATK